MQPLIVFDERPNPVVQRVARGSVVRHTLTLTVEDEAGEEQPLDPDGCTFAPKLVYPDGSFVSIDATVEETVDATLVHYAVDPDLAATLAAPEVYQLTCDMTDAAGDPKRICQVQLEVSP